MRRFYYSSLLRLLFIFYTTAAFLFLLPNNKTQDSVRAFYINLFGNIIHQLLIPENPEITARKNNFKLFFIFKELPS